MENYVPVDLAHFRIDPMSGLKDNLCPIIFMPCLGGGKELWHDIPYVIAEETNRRVYAFDLRNHGDSQWSDDFSYPIMIKDLRHFMDSKNIQKATLVGHSISGYISWQFALEFPERVKLLIIEDCVLIITSEEQWAKAISLCMMWANAVQKVPPYLSKTEAIKNAVDYMYDSIPLEKQESLSKKEVLYKCDYNLRCNDDGTYSVKENVKRFLKAFKEDSFEDKRCFDAVYNGPTYFIHGGLSNFEVYNLEEQFRKYFPKAEFFLIKNATHQVHIDAPEEYTEVLLKIILKK